jgi:hypothetical protein
VVATVLGAEISRDQLVGNEEYAILPAVLEPLLEDFRRRNNIVATDAEIDRCVGLMFKASSRAELAAAGIDEATARASERKVAESVVVNWKESKALYEKFGGTVIFQQSNPLEPVGAYLAFLREHEAKGSFRFLDDRLAAKFWEYFTKDHGHWVVDPAKVDYSKPWWERD